MTRPSPFFPPPAPPADAQPRRQGGFTLIELLVVLVIIGAMVSLSVLATGNAGASRELRDEAERLAALVGVLADEAVLDGKEYGLELDDESYRVLVYDELAASWSPLGSRPAHRVPASARLVLSLDGEPLKLPEPEPEKNSPGLGKDEDKQEKPIPQLLVLSSGELSPFSLRLEERRVGGNAYVLASDGYRLPEAEPAKP